MITIDPTLILDLQEAARAATLAAAQAFGFGGSTWTVERPSGGPGPRTLLPISGTVQALCFRTRPSRERPVAGGQLAMAEEWQVIVLDGDVQARDVLRSTIDSTVAVRVRSLERWYDYERGQLEQGVV